MLVRQQECWQWNLPSQPRQTVQCQLWFWSSETEWDRIRQIANSQDQCQVLSVWLCLVATFHCQLNSMRYKLYAEVATLNYSLWFKPTHWLFYCHFRSGVCCVTWFLNPTIYPNDGIVSVCQGKIGHFFNIKLVTKETLNPRSRQGKHFLHRPTTQPATNHDIWETILYMYLSWKITNKNYNFLEISDHWKTVCLHRVDIFVSFSHRRKFCASEIIEASWTVDYQFWTFHHH